MNNLDFLGSILGNIVNRKSREKNNSINTNAISNDWHFQSFKIGLGKGFGEPLPPTPVVLQFEEKKKPIITKEKKWKKKKKHQAAVSHP